MASEPVQAVLVWTTDTPSPPPASLLICRHGKDAGQTCYPCDVGDDEIQEWERNA